MTMITPSYLGETIEYSSLHACRSTLEDPTHQRAPPSLFLRRFLRWRGSQHALQRSLHLVERESGAGVDQDSTRERIGLARRDARQAQQGRLQRSHQIPSITQGGDFPALPPGDRGEPTNTVVHSEPFLSLGVISFAGGDFGST